MTGEMSKLIETTCLYCTKDEKILSGLLEIAELKVSKFYLSKDQTYAGRAVVVLNWHAKELFDLTVTERHAFADDVAQAAQALQQTFLPNKINYAIYGDMVPHLHCHLAPKYEGGDNWGAPFNNNPESKKLVSSEEYQVLINRIRTAL